ncbi:response regulator [Sphingobacterium sp. N143]|uniref:hybrid sensor histidine kinase/response regulator n=1 Tax=Sphingobacterium sp. N143 TaxID=2746727 RepID=UPI0025768F17|nr:ATP-binding protein [Sphingobacterium sp. N143]MDM1296405.1 response regulator [Sphingobacterium sp. N143]
MILIVDDNPDNIFSLQKLLESKNFKVDTAHSGEEALKKILKHNYALIILDVQMPDMDGFEVAENIAGFSKTKETPIIFLSAVNTDKRFITKGYNSGGLDYVTKPVDPDILMLKVKTFYRLYEQTQALKEIQQTLELEVERRKQAQKELRSKVDYLHTLLESLPQIAFSCDYQGNIDFVNGRWFQFSDSASSFPETHPDDMPIATALNESLGFGRPLEMEVRIRKRDVMDYSYQLLRVWPILENSKNNWIGTFTDIDAQKRAEKEKDEFLSIASHELKTPLTSIKAYMQLLDRKLKLDRECAEAKYVSRVQGQVEKLNSLITDLLDLSKIDNGKLGINKKMFLLEHMVQNAIDSIVQTHDQSNMNLYREGDISGLMVYGDEIRLEQVLVNFLTNAYKYAAGTEKVIVQCTVINDFVKVSVIDFGIGIPANKQKEVFDKFYRVEETSFDFQGLGIGLYICSEIIRSHQGEIAVESSAGKGATFYFTLPLNPVTDVK